MDCIFCKIVNGEIPSTKVYEDEKVLAFKDLDPKAPVHVLIIPKVHIISADNIDSSNSEYVAAVFEAAAKISRELKLEKGYRLVTNIGEDGGQSVGHLHFHMLGGRKLKWPPG